MAKRTVVLIAPSPSSFVEDDRRRLEARYPVRTLFFHPERAKTPWGMVQRLAAQRSFLRDAMPSAGLVLGWFADTHMALPMRYARRLNLPVALILGGMDVNAVPDLGYGATLSAWRRPLVVRQLREATHLLPVAKTLIHAQNTFASPGSVLEMGVRALIPDPIPPFTVLPTGYDPSAWPLGALDREPCVVSVAYCASERSWKLKGWDLLTEAARAMPEVPFYLVGLEEAFATTRRLPPNVHAIPPAKREELAWWYQRASVYAQLSRSEGLPNALCEAQLCGAIPIVSNVGGMPDAVGEHGYVVPRPDVDLVVHTLRDALRSTSGVRREAARTYVAETYSDARRTQGLYEIVDRYLPPA